MATERSAPAPPPLRGRPARWAALAVVMLAAALRFAAWTTPVEVLDGWAMPDDTYLSLELAVQIANGRGPLYGDAPTSGFQPLIVLATAGVMRALGWYAQLDDVTHLDRLVTIATAIGALADLLVVVLLLAWGWRHARTTPGALAAPLLWAIHPTALRMSVNGLETSLAVLGWVVLALALRRALARPPGPLLSVALGALVGVAGLARIDLLPVAAIAAAWWWIVAGRRGMGVGERLRTAACVAAGFALVYGPWMAWLAAWTGRVVPVSGPAVRELSLPAIAEGGAWHALAYDTPSIALEALWLNGRSLLALSAVALLAVAAESGGRRRTTHAMATDGSEALPLTAPAGTSAERPRDGLGAPIGFLAAAAVVHIAAYCWYVMGWWFFDRYLMPVTICWVFVLAWAIDRPPLAALPAPRAFRMRIASRARGAAGLALAVALVVADGATAPMNTYARFLRSEPDLDLSYRAFGLWAAANTPPGTVVGALQTGALAYYARDLEVVNLDGVVNEAAFTAIRERRLLAYARGRGVEIMYLSPLNLQFLRAKSSEADRAAPRVIGVLEGLRSWKSTWLIVLPE